MPYHFAAVLAASALLMACSGSAATSAGGDLGSAPDAAADAGGSADLFAGLDPTPGSGCTAGRWVAGARGRLVEEDGTPIEGARAQLCIRISPSDILLCLRPGTASSEGSFQQVVPPEARCMALLTLRALVPRSDRATVYCDIPLQPGDPILTLPRPYVLPRTTRAAEIPPLGDPEAVRTLRFDDGLEIDLVPGLYFGSGDGYEALAARYLDLAAGDPAAAAICQTEVSRTFLGVYAFSPEGNIKGAADLRIPDRHGLAEGSAVELFVLGGLSCTTGDGALIQEGVWVKFGEGAVQGGQIVASGDDGLPCLNWMGYRPRP